MPDPVFFRQLQHLLPRAHAWSTTANKTLRRFVQGIAPAAESARNFVDTVRLGIFPNSTEEISEWERQFGVFPAGNESDRRVSLGAAWAAQGGQSPRYLQETLQAAGFGVFVHEWWDPNQPLFHQVQCGEALAQCGEARAQASDKLVFRFVRDPTAYTQPPRIGHTQCGEALAQCGEAAALCDKFLVNECGYIVNENLTRRAPPPIPDDTDKWHYFLYWCGENFGDRVVLPLAQRAEFERQLLKLCPEQQWLVVMVDYDAGGGVFDDSFNFAFE